MELLQRHKQMTSDEDRPGSDPERAEAIRKGDVDAFEDLFRSYYDDLVLFVSAIVCEHEVAEELVQDVFYKIWRQHAEWRPRGPLRTYLYGAARNHALRHLRRRRMMSQWREEKSQEPERITSGPEQDLRYKELSEEVDHAIQAMPERRRLVYQLSRWHGLTYAEIAAVLDISVHAVEVHIVRALKFLRQRLSEYLPVML